MCQHFSILYSSRPTISRGIANETVIGTPNNRRMLHDLYLQEKKSLLALRSFVGRANEVLNLWKVLYDHQFNLVASTLSPVSFFSCRNLRWLFSTNLHFVLLTGRIKFPI